MPIWLPMKVWVPAQAAVSLPRRWELRPTGSLLSGGKPTTSTALRVPRKRSSRLLTEGSNTLSVIYGATGDNGLTGTVSGIQQDLNVFTSFSCNEATLTPGLRVDYIPTSCGSPTPTATATATPTPTAIFTPTPTATVSATPTATATPSCTPGYAFTSGTGTIIPGVTDTGNHCDDCSTSSRYRFSHPLWHQLHIRSCRFQWPPHLWHRQQRFTLSCMPVTPGTDVLGPYWRDQRTDSRKRLHRMWHLYYHHRYRSQPHL